MNEWLAFGIVAVICRLERGAAAHLEGLLYELFSGCPILPWLATAFR